MSRNLGALWFGCCVLLVSSAGCASRPGWGFRWGQGTSQGDMNRQNARAAVHDPFPLNDIGPEVVGGRPREYYHPMPEPARNTITDRR